MAIAGLLIGLMSILLCLREHGGLRRGREQENSQYVEQSEHTRHLLVKSDVSIIYAAAKQPYQ